jgi:hypothetical protein
MSKINIVYFIWINLKKNYECIILGQLNDIINSNILSEAKLYIEICCEYEDITPIIKEKIDNTLQSFDYEMTFHTINIFEYYGIKKMYDLALKEPNKYYLYLHSKGMFNYDNTNTRHNFETTLTKGTVYQYKKVIELFETNSNISKIGLFPAIKHDGRYIWLNFYWSKGTYLNTCEDPIQTTYRYYYETWSGSGEKDSLIYNLHENNYKKYELHEVAGILINLNGNYYLTDDNSESS